MNFRVYFLVRPEADIVMITTPDSLHYEPALMALEAGYHLLLEKRRPYAESLPH